MKVMDLQCAGQHVFEGWFGSEDDFRGQLERGLLTCPVCGDADVRRKISAPRLQRKSNSLPAAEAGDAQAAVPAASSEAVAAPEEAGQDWARLRQAAYLRAVRHVLRHTEDVGVHFAEEARRMHYGEAETRGIRGQASPEERLALADEGIEVAILPLPKDMDGPLQ